MTTGLARSVQVRLVRHAHALGIDPNVILARYAAERLLYRLSRSPHAERFVLKGALMLFVWLGEGIRATRDADLLGFGAVDPESLRATFAEVCTMTVVPDGLEFDPQSLRIDLIRPLDAYGGQRVTVIAYLGSARIRVQVDIGVGDAVVPEPEWIEYPGLLDLPAPRLRAYRPETTVAEKLHAVVELDSKNSRMRDFFDLHALATHMTFNGVMLAAAIEATFQRRGTAVPTELPLGLTPDFAEIPGKSFQWSNFVRRLPGAPPAPDLASVIRGTAAFAGPVLLAAGRRDPFDLRWPAGGPAWLDESGAEDGGKRNE